MRVRAESSGTGRDAEGGYPGPVSLLFYVMVEMEGKKLPEGEGLTVVPWGKPRVDGDVVMSGLGPDVGSWDLHVFAGADTLPSLRYAGGLMAEEVDVAGLTAMTMLTRQKEALAETGEWFAGEGAVGCAVLCIGSSVASATKLA